MLLPALWDNHLHAPATQWTINAVHTVAGKGLNLGPLPARAILGMFMNDMILHLHLQFVGLHTCSDLWLNILCVHRADFFRFHTRVQQGGEVVS